MEVQLSHGITPWKNGSIKSWDDMIDAFRAKFSIATDKVGLADLANTKPKKGE